MTTRIRDPRVEETKEDGDYYLRESDSEKPVRE